MEIFEDVDTSQPNSANQINSNEIDEPQPDVNHASDL